MFLSCLRLLKLNSMELLMHCNAFDLKIGYCIFYVK